jgi:arabinofuranosyltransferase
VNGRIGRALAGAALVAMALGFLYWARAFIAATTVELPEGRFHTLFDDAMISMRYAWSCAHGRGLVFNPGQRVEGFSSPLWVVAGMAPAAALFGKSAAVLAVQWLGALCLLGAAAATARVAATLVAGAPPAWRKVAALAGFAVTLLYYPLCFWTLEGMETGLVALLVTSALALAAAERRRQPRARPLFGVLLGLLVCTRLDASLAAAILWLFRAGSLPRARRRLLVSESAIAAGLVVVMMIARRGYFGAWLPNTYYLKLQGLPASVRWHNGWIFVRPFWKQEVGGALVLTLFGAAWQRSSLALTIGLLLATATLYQASVGGDPWTYWRQMAPYVPLVILGSGWSALTLLERLPWLGIAVAALVLYDGVVRANAPFAAEAHFRELPYLVDENRKNVRLAIELARLVTPEARLGLIAAGVTGYYSDNEIVDFLGKTDPHIAQLPPDLHFGFHDLSTVPGHNKYDLNYSIVQLRPDYVQVDSWGRQTVRPFVDEHYQRVGRLLLLRGSPRVRWDVAAALRR